MFVGEAPGETEQQTGRPFVGRAGQLLQSILQQLDIPMTSIYVSNVVKHRPPGNATPSLAQIQACMPFLLQEIQYVNPRVIVTLGTTATQGLGATVNEPLPTKGLRGYKFAMHTATVHATWHPAYALRNPAAVPQLTQDIQRAWTIACT
jgi:DNA polymerase